MKYISSLYCLLLACLLALTQSAGAQVTGNKFLNAIDVNSKVSTSGATITAKTPGGTSAGNTWNYTIQKAFDGDRDKTWWSSSQSGTINIDIAFTSEITLACFHIFSGGQSWDREQNVVVYTSKNGSSWTQVQSFGGNRNQRDNDYILNSPVTTRYLRLQLQPRSTENYLIINEITLYSNSYATLTHKYSKWFDLREPISEAARSLDTFNDETPWFTLQDGTTKVQAAHVYMDTIYVHKGTSVSLEVPDKLDRSSVSSYQRWYSFRTDHTFRTQNTGTGEVWDLLTTPGSNQAYRMSNGYIGKPITTNDVMTMNFYVPTDDEFNNWFSDIATNYDNNYYLVGCDVSGYTDYTEEFSATASGNSNFYPSNQADGKSYEPTLTHRIIYYIVAVDDRDSGLGDTEAWRNGMKRLKDKAYQGGTDDGKYLEEYDISFPFTRVSDNTLELVALSKDARSYAIPDAETADNSNISVRLVDGGSGITLATTSLSGQKRAIQFNYPNNYSDGTQYVNADNSKATIYVTKTVGGITYNIAKYNLTFKRATRLITETQLQQIENGTIKDENLKYYQFRTDKYLSENYTLLTKLNFDYDTEVGNMYGQAGFYPFPLDWTSSSYSFYDGSNGTDYKPVTGYFPEWGYYSILSGFVENIANWGGAVQGHALPNSTYHMYIDASDRPGVIARLPFQQNLCAGSEMFVTAWVKSAGASKTNSDAGMLFSIMGVTKDEATGQDVYVPIYRHASSQIRCTYYMDGRIPGTGSNTNEWMQVYFSFIVDSDVSYDSYVLQIDNNSESTRGGDMYIDDIRVYLATASAKVSQLEAACTGDRTMMSIELDWDRILSRLGDIEGTDGIEGIDFCFIDKAKYESWLAAHPGEYEAAIDTAVVEIGNNEQGEGFYNEKYNTLYFDLTFDNNASYDDKPHPRLARDNVKDGKFFFYRKTDGAGLRSLAVDFYSALTPNRSYMMLIQINDGNPANATDFAEGINDACSINTPFYVTAQSLLRVNGEIVDPTRDFCAGQIFSFSAQVRVPQSDEDGTESYITIDKGVYFDWFFGTEEEFLAANPKYGDESLQNALTTFRSVFPNKGDLDGIHEGQYDDIDGNKVTITQDMIDIINDYLEQEPPLGGQNNRLVLYRDKLDITLLNSGLQLVIQPIQTLVPPSEAIDTTLWANVCWSYIPVELHASGAAPQLRAGFNPLKYPSDDFNPGLRIGLSQIAELKENKPLKVSLRGATFVTAGVTSLGKVTSASPEVFEKIYLIRTDDPAYNNDTFFPTDFSEYSLPVGTIKTLQAKDYQSNPNFDDHMEIYFDTETTHSNGFRFQPKEGYFYELAFHFEEKADGGISANTCFGVFNIVMRVVPENLVWKGNDYTGNWNNDKNWKRADKGELKKAYTDTYPTNEENTTDGGFVPMLFSNVIIPEDKKVELYMAGYGESGNAWVNSSRPSHIEAPADSIQYDLMTYENEDSVYSTQRYRVNICRDIHFEPGAQMLHAEQLIYNKAWTDVEITPGQWTAVSTPLHGVVAGDWYAPSANGRQETEYFKDITFNTTDYNRLNPAVYQRSWSTGANIVENLQGTNTPVSFTTEWSSAYNDASVPYVAGGGFSIKGVKKEATSLLFRFPKADTNYGVSTGDGNVGRTNAGKLLISGMVDRSNPYQSVHSDEVTVKLTPSADGKYLMVGNPFMAPLDVQAFVEANNDVLAQKYWIGSDVSEDNAVAYTETGWSAPTYLIAPYSVFYVEALGSTSDDGTVTYADTLAVKFTAAMQKFETTSTGDEGLQAASLKITAEDAEGSSSAAVRYSASASNGFGMEDAQMISGLTGNADNAPKVYTVAGNTAVSVNQLKDAQRIPLGVTAADGSVVTLTFSGVAAVKDASLYDAELKTETTLYDGYQLTVNGASYGRYFLIGHGSGTTGITETAVEGNVSVSSIVPRQVVVTSDTGLRSVSVWSAGGALLKKVTPDGSYTCTLNGVDSGMVIVRTDTENGSNVTKIRVR